MDLLQKSGKVFIAKIFRHIFYQFYIRRAGSANLCTNTIYLIHNMQYTNEYEIGIQLNESYLVANLYLNGFTFLNYLL